MRTHTSTYEGTINYPDALAMMFNPSPVVVTGSAGVWVSVTATDGVNTYAEKRTTFGTDCTFDLSVIARSLFADIAKAEPNYSTFIDQKHTIDVNFTVKTYKEVNIQPTFTFSVTYVFGLLRHGEVFNAYKKRTWWKQYPFTLDVYVEAGDTLGFVVDGSPQSVQSVVNAGIYNIPVDSMGVTDTLLVQDHITSLSPTPFEDVFDLTFSAIDGNAVEDRALVVASDEYCPKAVYLRWLDNQGMYCYWLFSWLGDTHTSDIEENIVRDDMAHYQQGAGYQGWFGHREQRNSTETKAIGASRVDADIFAFLLTLLTSSRVDRFIGYDSNNDPIWENVRVTAQSTAWQRHRDYQDFACSVIMPKYTYQGV